MSELENLKRIIESEPQTSTRVPMRSCVCGKLLVEAEHTRLRHSGIKNFKECFCPDCRKEFEPFVRVVCLGCGTLAALQAPSRASTGFEFKRGSCVHVYRCPECVPDLTVLPVLEHVQYCRAKGIPTNVDLDIVQEAERKFLQGKAEADKMRSELKDSFPAP